jgi:hypothetical protein
MVIEKYRSFGRILASFNATFLVLNPIQFHLSNTCLSLCVITFIKLLQRSSQEELKIRFSSPSLENNFSFLKVDRAMRPSWWPKKVSIP